MNLKVEVLHFFNRFCATTEHFPIVPIIWHDRSKPANAWCEEYPI